MCNPPDGNMGPMSGPGGPGPGSGPPGGPGGPGGNGGGNGGPGNSGPGPDGPGPGNGNGNGNIINGEPNMNTMKSSPANGPGTPREEGNMGEFNMGGYGNNGENVRVKVFYHLISTILKSFDFKNNEILILQYYVCRIKMNPLQYSKSKKACKRKQNDLKRMEIILTISCNDEPLDKFESYLFSPQ